MKLFIRSFILLLATTLLFSTSVLANYDYKNKRESLVALGDSIPYGYNLDDNNDSPSQYAFPYLMGLDADIQVPNLAVYGFKTEDMLVALESEKYIRTIGNADYITVNIGSNDLIEVLFSTWVLTQFDSTKSFDGHLNEEIEESELFPNLQEIIVKIRSLTDAPVIIYNIYNPFQTYNPMHDLIKDELPEINKTFEEHVTLLNETEKDIFLADAFGAFGTNQADYVIDSGIDLDIHPTVAGQKKLADIGLDILESYKEKEEKWLAMRYVKERSIHRSFSNDRSLVKKPEIDYRDFAQRILMNQ